jgi:3-oxoacyl-[acyl-carrier-protein] synthase-3
MAARIIGVGKHLPSRVMKNAELERLVDTSDEWIAERTGIRERRIAADDESAASLGAEASRMALRTAGIDGESIELVVCGTSTPDGIFPATASLIQDAIGAKHAAAFDVNAACTGFMVALATGAQFVEAGLYRRVLVVGSEVMSRIVNWRDRSTCVLFGDGAGAVVLERAESGGPLSFILKSDGAAANILYVRGPTSAPLSISEAEGYFMVMDGREVYRFAVRAMEEASREAIAAAALTVEDIALAIPHQANLRIMTAVAKGLGLPQERMFANVERYGNTSSASIPVALCEAWEQGRLDPGDNILIVAVGGGLAWGASVIQWTGLGTQTI